MGLSTENAIKLRMGQLVLVLILFIHWSSCLLYVVIYNNYFNIVHEIKDSEDAKVYYINKNGNRAPVF